MINVYRLTCFLALASVALAVTTDLLPTDDSFIRSGVYGGNNYGNLAYLEIKDTAVRSDFTRETFLKYDLSSITGTITSVQLIVTATPDSPPLNIDVSVMPDNWNEGTVTWPTQPPVGALAGNIGASGVGNLNIGALQTVWNDKIVSFQLWDSRKLDQTFKIVSKEGGSPAKLRIQHDAPAPSTTTGSGSTTGTSTGTIDFAPIADSYVRGGANAGDNYGTATTLAIKTVAGSTEWNRESFLKFNLNSINGLIKTAELVVKVQAGTAVLNFDVAVVNDDNWAENTINWNNKPATGDIAGHVGNSGVATLDVAKLNAVLGDKILTLRFVDSLSQDTLMTIGSKEGGVSASPILKITV